MLSYDGRFLIDDKTISYVGSGREITRLAQTAAKVVTSAPVVIGNPDFDLDLAKAGSEGIEILGSPSVQPEASGMQSQMVRRPLA